MKNKNGSMLISCQCFAKLFIFIWNRKEWGWVGWGLEFLLITQSQVEDEAWVDHGSSFTTIFLGYF